MATLIHIPPAPPVQVPELLSATPAYPRPTKHGRHTSAQNVPHRRLRVSPHIPPTAALQPSEDHAVILFAIVGGSSHGSSECDKLCYPYQPGKEATKGPCRPPRLRLPLDTLHGREAQQRRPIPAAAVVMTTWPCLALPVNRSSVGRPPVPCLVVCVSAYLWLVPACRHQSHVTLEEGIMYRNEEEKHVIFRLVGLSGLFPGYITEDYMIHEYMPTMRAMATATRHTVVTCHVHHSLL